MAQSTVQRAQAGLTAPVYPRWIKIFEEIRGKITGLDMDTETKKELENSLYELYAELLKDHVGHAKNFFLLREQYIRLLKQEFPDINALEIPRVSLQEFDELKNRVESFTKWSMIRYGEAEKDTDKAELKAKLDPKTNLLNQKFFVRQLERLLATERRHSGFALWFIDLRHFRRINKRFGHQVADHIIARMADLLRSNIRRSNRDLLSRFGGDEFCVLITNLNVQKWSELQIVCRRFADKIKEQNRIGWGDIIPKNSSGRRKLNVYADIGVIAFQQSEEFKNDPSGTVDRLIRKANEAMFYAKQSAKLRKPGSLDLDGNHFCFDIVIETSRKPPVKTHSTSAA